MKALKASLLIAVLATQLFAQQQPDTLPISAPTPPGPDQVAVNITGTPGSRTLFYWLVARYPIGFSGIVGPFSTSFAAATLSGANSVIVSWRPPSGATGFDVLRTAIAIPPIPGTCTCSVVVNTSASQVTDSTEALGAYTFTAPAAPVSTSFFLNNRDFVQPRIRVGALLQSTVGGIGFPDGTIQASAAAMTASVLNDPGGNGIVVRTALSTTINRSMAATAPITLTNADGTLGNPTYACPTCTTSAAALTANNLLIGGGGQAMAALGTLGTTTTVLHGNAAGAPTFGSVDLQADVSNFLNVVNGGTGRQTFTTNGTLIGNGAGGILVSSAGAANTIFRVGGGGGAPDFGAIDLAQAAAVGSTILGRANGGTGDSVLQSRTSSFCSGAATASSTLHITLWPSAACTNVAEGATQQLLVSSAGRLRNLRALAGTAGVAAGSGIITLRINGANSIVTCTIGVGTTCSDTVNTATVAAGDRITVRMVTAGAETLANVQIAWEY